MVMPCLLEGILDQPAWLLAWIGWMVAVNTACLFFLKRIEARWVLAAWIANAVFMTALCELNGYNRLLGLSHLVFWTPLVIYLFRRRAGFGDLGLAGGWLWTVILTNSASLVVDVIDVIRYFLPGTS